MSQYLTLRKNAEIIGKFCKSKFISIIIAKQWKRLYKKYALKQRQNNIMHIIKKNILF